MHCSLFEVSSLSRERRRINDRVDGSPNPQGGVYKTETEEDSEKGLIRARSKSNMEGKKSVWSRF